MSSDPNVLCCFFARGSCKYGNKCKYSHVDDGLKPCSQPGCKKHTVPRPAPTGSTSPAQGAAHLPPPTSVLKFIVDGGNFYNAASHSSGPDSKNQKVITALRATVDHLKGLFPGTKIEGTWIDLDVNEYVEFLEKQVSDPASRQGLISAARNRQRTLCGAMNSITGTVPELTYKMVGKFKAQSGFVEGVHRSQVWVQSAVDESVLCHTIEAYIDPSVSTVVLFTGDGDMAPVFDLCNVTLRRTSGKHPLRLSAVSWSCSSEFGSEERLAGEKAIQLDFAIPDLFVKPPPQTDDSGREEQKQGRGRPQPKKSNPNPKPRLPQPFVNALTQRSAILEIPGDARPNFPGKTIFRQGKNWSVSGFKDVDDAKACATQIRGNFTSAEVLFAYGCRYSQKDVVGKTIPQPPAGTKTATMIHKDSIFCLFPSEAEMRQMQQVLTASGITLMPVRLSVDARTCKHREIVFLPMKQSGAHEAEAEVVVDQAYVWLEEEVEEEDTQRFKARILREMNKELSPELGTPPPEYHDAMNPDDPVPEFVDAMLAYDPTLRTKFVGVDLDRFIDFLIRNQAMYLDFSAFTDEDKAELVDIAKTGFYQDDDAMSPVPEFVDDILAHDPTLCTLVSTLLPLSEPMDVKKVCSMLQLSLDAMSLAPATFSSRGFRLMRCIHKLSTCSQLVPSVKSKIDTLTDITEREDYVIQFVEDVELCLSESLFDERKDNVSIRSCLYHSHNFPFSPDWRQMLVTLGYPETEYDALIAYVSSRFPSIPLEQKIAVRIYTFKEFHKRLNSALRSGTHADWNPFIKCLRQGIVSLPLPTDDHNLVVFRGQSAMAEMSLCVGDTMVWPGFVSTSRSPQIALKFCGTTTSVKYLFVIFGITNRHLGADISKLSVYPDEEEILLVPNIKMKVLTIADQVISGNSVKVIGVYCQGAVPLPVHPWSSNMCDKREVTESCTFCDIEKALEQPMSSSCPSLLLLQHPTVFQSILGHPDRGNQIMRTLQPGKVVTWLYEASRNGHADAVRSLLLLHADVLFQEEVSGWTPLQAAVNNDRLDCVKAILEFTDNITQNVLFRSFDHQMVRNQTADYVQQYNRFST